MRAPTCVAVLGALALVAEPTTAWAEPGGGQSTRDAVTHSAPSREAASAGEAEAPLEPGARFRVCKQGRRWSCCAPGSPCIRSGAARLLLLSIGAIAGGVAGGILFGLGDRLAGGDPATLLVGTGALAAGGAIVGSIAGRLGADAPGDSDRIRPITVGLASDLGGTAVLDEADPASLALTFAPTYRFPDRHGRLRLIGHVGGDLFARKDVDPRPQLMDPEAAEQGTRPVTLTERELSIGIGFDVAVALPYPVLSGHRTAFLGPAELRYKPEFQIRRETVGLPGDREQTIERTMLLPLTVGARWHLSPRQRFTVYIGPRFDVVSMTDASGRMQRGKAEIGPIYGEAWFDLDVPFTRRPPRHGRTRKATVNGQLSVGYVHSRFDGHGLNFGPVIGFLGPIVAWWHTRVRPRGWPVALQGGAGLTMGTGVTASLRLGVVLPDINPHEARQPR